MLLFFSFEQLKTTTMKKLFITTALVSGMAFGSHAQKKGDIEGGINIGINTSIVSGDYYWYDSGSGLNVGLSADYYLSSSWSLKAKLVYDQKGFDNVIYTSSFDPVDHGYYTDVNMNYLTVPVMANWHFGRTRNWYLNFGPYVGFLLNAKETTGGEDLSDLYKSADFGLAFGIGVKIPVSNKLKISLEYDGQGGLTNIANNNEGYDLYNARGCLSVGVNFLMK
jgi:opacity protein-like surface antigen